MNDDRTKPHPLSSPEALLAFIDKDIDQPDYPRKMLIDEIKQLRGAVREGGRHSNEYLANEAAFERREREDLQRRRPKDRVSHIREGYMMALAGLRRCDERLRVSPRSLAADLERQAPGEPTP